MKRRSFLRSAIGALAATGLLPSLPLASTSGEASLSSDLANDRMSGDKPLGVDDSTQRIASSVHREVMGLFTYEHDTPTESGYEVWDSFADTVRRGEPFYGDCDDFALTCAELLLSRGVDRSSVHVLTCYTETGIHHAVAIADGWALDNRQSTIRTRDSLPYEWRLAMRLDHPGRWREFTG